MAETSNAPQRKRARQACLACNARRVKCDVTERQPCQNCITANAECLTRESRRGKHPRPSKKRASVSSVVSLARSQNEDEVAGAHVLASLHRNRIADVLQPETAISGFLPEGQTLSPKADLHREEDADVFLGETTSLRYVYDEPAQAAPTAASPSHAIRMRYSVPSAARAEALVPDWEVQRRLRRKEHLKQEGAFSFPPKAVVEELLKAYFRWFHPCFAVVDEMDVWSQYQAEVLSPLLLHSMLFVGVLHCEDAVLDALGEGPRHRAKYIFFTRAKDMYDAEIEPKKLTVIQSLFLMSFWRAGAGLEKDTRHWLGAALSLAQNRALHRAAGNADSQAAKLRKRIWWSLYTRDRQCAAALGLPNRVRDEDCDFESLEPSDFQHAFNPSVSPKDAEQYAVYAIGMTELAKFLGQIVHSGYLPGRTLEKIYREQLRLRMNDWKSHLPPTMQPDNEFGGPPSFYANMQHLAYNNLLILMYRQDYITNKEEGKEGAEGSVAILAAARNTRIIEDMLTDNTLRHGQIHVITNLFNTLCMNTVQLRRSEGTTRTVAESRAKLCLHGLQELQKTWEVTNWVLQLFFQYLDRSTAASLRVQPPNERLATPGGAKWSRDPSPNIKPQQHGFFDPVQHAAAPNSAGELQAGQTVMLPPPSASTPFSWTSDDPTTQFLFSRIEDEFAFGEGEMVDWNPEEVDFGGPLFPPNDGGPSNYQGGNHYVGQ